MSWLSQYASELSELEELRLSQAPAGVLEALASGTGTESQVVQDVTDILSQVVRSEGDPAAFERMARIWWDLFGAEELKATRKQVAIHAKLSTVYTRLLSSGTSGEWNEFGMMQVRARLGSPGFLSMLKRLYPT